jgi:hypothetical protein
MLRVFIERQRDFGREMNIAVIDFTEGEFGRTEEHAIVPVRNGITGFGLERIPLKEGERIPESAYLLRFPERIGEEFLRALTAELARHGFVTPDPHGHRVTEMGTHIETLKKEKDRYFDLTTTLIETVTAIAKRKIR